MASADGCGIAAVAARIHERAVLVQNEQLALQQVQLELQEWQIRHTEETQRARHVRQQYLQSALELHTLELEQNQVQDQISQCQSKTEAVQQETADILSQLELQQKTWENTVLISLVQHQVRQELFQKHLRGAIEAHHLATGKRQTLLDKLERLTQQSERERTNAEMEQQRVQVEMKHMADKEHEINHRVDALASQVREALNRVRHLNIINNNRLRIVTLSIRITHASFPIADSHTANGAARSLA